MIVKKVDLLAPMDKKENTLYEIVGEIADKTNEVIDTVNNLDPMDVNTQITALTTKVNTKADKATTLDGYGITDAYNITETDFLLSEKMGVAAAYTKAEIDTSLAAKADRAATLAGYGIGDAYTKAQVDTSLANKADKATTLGGYGITDAYTKAQVDTSLANKADRATTLGGYGITDAYTKAQVDTSLAAKADKATTLGGYGITDAYSKPEIDTSLAGKASTTHTHNYVDIANKPATFPPNLMTGSVIGGAMVGNGLGMSGNYLFLKALRGTKIDTTDNAVVVDRAATDTWYVAKAPLTLTNVATFSNGWTHLAGRELKYSVTGEKMLWLNGIVDGAAATSSATGIVIATLPAGLTPQVNARCVVGLSGDLQGMIDVGTDGTIKIVASFTGVSTFKGWASINVMVPLT